VPCTTQLRGGQRTQRALARPAGAAAPRAQRRRPAPAAGHDTSSATIMQLFIALSTHPRCVAKLRAEQEQARARLARRPRGALQPARTSGLRLAPCGAGGFAPEQRASRSSAVCCSYAVRGAGPAAQCAGGRF